MSHAAPRRRTALAQRLPKALWEHAPAVPFEDRAQRARRRRVVTAVSLGGAVLLGRSLSTEPGSRGFYGLTLAAAGLWTAGGLASGPLHLGYIEHRDAVLRRPVLTPVLTGIGAFGGFYAAALLARRIPVLDSALVRVLRFAHQGDPRLVAFTALANGAAEEVFFRGALYAACGRSHPVAVSTLVYTAATIPTRNPALVLAAGAMGTLFALQRQASGGIQASMLTHLSWSALMLRYLPPLFEPST